MVEENQSEASLNRQIKDTVFTDIFKNKKYILDFYNSIHSSDEENSLSEDDIKILTLQNVLVNGVYNDLGFMVKDKLIILAEAQSTFNPNMPMRMLIYVAETYNRYIKENEISLYSSKPYRFPTPELYLIYTGKEKIGRNEIHLSDLFSTEIQSFIDLKIAIIDEDNIRENKKYKGIAEDYIKFCSVYDDIKYDSDLNTMQKVKKIIDYCIDNNILKEYLESRKVEVKEMLMSVLTQEEALKFYHRELKKEMKEELREEVKAEVKEEVKAEVKEEVKAEVKEEVKAEVRAEVGEEQFKNLQVISKMFNALLENGLDMDQIIKSTNITEQTLQKLKENNLVPELNKM